MKQKPFFVIQFRDINRKVHIDTYLSQKDADGYVMLIYQRDGIKSLLHKLIKQLDEPLEVFK